jgi:hypothetical protein
MKYSGNPWMTCQPKYDVAMGLTMTRITRTATKVAAYDVFLIAQGVAEMGKKISEPPPSS